MLIYPLLLGAGLIGLLVMAALGFSHGHTHAAGHGQAGGHSHLTGPNAGVGPGAHGHTHAGPAHGGARPAGSARAATGKAAHAPGARGGSSQTTDGRSAEAETAATATGLLWLMPLLSPLTWFSWLVGAGAAGTLCAVARIPEPVRAGIAVAGAIGFNQAILKPVWNLIFGFASEPAGNLEACLLQKVEAVTAFDEQGQGLVRVVIDGRSDDILARLTKAAREAGHRVRRGDWLIVEEVDVRRNRCVVSPE